MRYSKADVFSTLIVALALLFLVKTYFQWTIRAPFVEYSAEQPLGMEPVECWFLVGDDWPVTECYYMHVAENHADTNGRYITFPVIVFRSNSLFSIKAPFLHLGAGGPGAPMALDSSTSVQSIWQNFDDVSLNQGRDLFVIDPRGTGLSQPLLTCDIYVDNVLGRMARAMSYKQEWIESDSDYQQCIDRFKQAKIDFNYFNSLSIANDVEQLRQAANVPQWVLYGVSYSTVYAQFVARIYPESVAALVLDSTVFPNIPLHQNYLTETMAPFNALYDYCNRARHCKKPIANVEQRIWDLHRELNKKPILMELDHPTETTKIRFVLTGNRFIYGLMQGIYSLDIFDDLPIILNQLALGKTAAIRPYLDDYIAFQLDRSYGDVSAEAHFCFEQKPFMDIELMKTLAQQLPKGDIREHQLLDLSWPDFCSQLGVKPASADVVEALLSDIPTLFLHGTSDTITLLSNVMGQQANFRNSQLHTFKQSHGIMNSEQQAEDIAADFIAGL